MIDLQEYGYYDMNIELPEGLIPARIVEIQKALYKVVCQYGEITASLRGSFFHRAEDRCDYPAVGDFVLLKYNAMGNSGISMVLPRKSKFSRTDYAGHAAGYVKTIQEQVVAANFDYVFIMSSLNQDFNIKRIARYLTQARQSGGIPVVVLTKADLCEDCQAQIDAVKAMAGDIDIIPLSSYTGMGIQQLSHYLQPGRTIVFLGMSGVGKSSLLNVLAGETVMTVSEIREDDARGHHTTTHRQLIRLSCGSMIIDTPGMRELGLWDAEEGISMAFSDVEDLVAQCRFSDCRHKNEPGCAIKAALADGTLSPKQWDNYLAQKRETEFVDRRVKIKNKK